MCGNIKSSNVSITKKKKKNSSKKTKDKMVLTNLNFGKTFAMNMIR